MPHPQELCTRTCPYNTADDNIKSWWSKKMTKGNALQITAHFSKNIYDLFGLGHVLRLKTSNFTKQMKLGCK
jgi:hypothetical protein